MLAVHKSAVYKKLACYYCHEDHGVDEDDMGSLECEKSAMNKEEPHDRGPTYVQFANKLIDQQLLQILIVTRLVLCGAFGKAIHVFKSLSHYIAVF